ncbi:hypothetical protein LXL04_018601 [Taraxacum kok-saghyz]
MLKKSGMGFISNSNSIRFKDIISRKIRDKKIVRTNSKVKKQLVNSSNTGRSKLKKIVLESQPDEKMVEIPVTLVELFQPSTSVSNRVKDGEVQKTLQIGTDLGYNMEGAEENLKKIINGEEDNMIVL